MWPLPRLTVHCLPKFDYRKLRRCCPLGAPSSAAVRAQSTALVRVSDVSCQSRPTKHSNGGWPAYTADISSFPPVFCHYSFFALCYALWFSFIFKINPYVTFHIPSHTIIIHKKYIIIAYFSPKKQEYIFKVYNYRTDKQSLPEGAACLEKAVSRGSHSTISSRIHSLSCWCWGERSLYIKGACMPCDES